MYPESIAGVVGIDVAVDGDGDVYTYTDTYIYKYGRESGGWVAGGASVAGGVPA
jgi:hypothetical protein